MKKIIYTRADGGISIVSPAPKKDLEKVLGPLTHKQYKKHVMERSIPAGITCREIEGSDLPASRELRNAWVDKTPESTIDICCEKAKDILLVKLRASRNEALAASDVDMTRALEDNDLAKVNAMRTRRSALRNATESLKAVDVVGKLNDKVLLAELARLSVLQENV